MKTNTDIKDLWNRQPLPVIDPSIIHRKTERFRKRKIRNLFILNTTLLLSIFFIAFIWIYFKPQFISTKIGIVLTILPIGIALLFNNKLLPLYKKVDECQSNSDYLKSLLLLKNKEHFLQTKIMNIYFVLLSVGICLYIYEYTLNRSLLFGIIAYIGILIWIGFNYFYLRPRIIRKNNHKINTLIKHIEAVKSQLNK